MTLYIINEIYISFLFRGVGRIISITQFQMRFKLKLHAKYGMKSFVETILL